MDDNMIREVMQSRWHDKWLLNNKFKWEFLDEYTFTTFKRDANCPSYSSEALGNVFDGKRWIEAMIGVQMNESKRLYMSLYLHDPKLDANCYWNDMITVVDVERSA